MNNCPDMLLAGWLM